MSNKEERESKSHKVNLSFLVTLVVLLIVAAVFAWYYVTASGQISEKNTQISECTQQKETLQGQLNSANSQISSLEDQAKSLQDQISSLQSQISSANSEISSVQAQLSSLQRELDAILDTKVVQYYSFTYQSHQFDWMLSVPLRTYFHYKEQPKIDDVSKYNSMITDTYADSLINVIVVELKEATLTFDLGKADVVNMVSAFVHSLTHTNNDPTTPNDGYPCYPIETLFQQGGDSEDNSVLTAAILNRLDFNMVFFVFAGQKHMAIGIDIPAYTGLTSWEYEAKKYAYLETTGDFSWQLGMCPNAYAGIRPTIIPITK